MSEMVERSENDTLIERVAQATCKVRRERWGWFCGDHRKKKANPTAVDLEQACAAIAAYEAALAEAGYVIVPREAT